MSSRLLHRILRPLNAGRFTDLLAKVSTRTLALVFVLCAFSMTSRAAIVTLTGSFTADDDVQLFSVHLAAPATVEFQTFGYAGGTTPDGTVVPGGGFDPILTLFDSTGAFLIDNDEYIGAPIDPLTGYGLDARIVISLGAGTYTLALTQYDNFAFFDLIDGFVQTGNPNFTADPSFTGGDPCASGLFRDISGTPGRCREGGWTVSFSNVTDVAPIPEPSTLLLSCAGFLLLLFCRKRRKAAATLAVCVTCSGLVSQPAHAQTTSGHNYANDNDFLKGHRTLLKTSDLIIGYSDREGNNWFSYYPVWMNNSQPSVQAGNTTLHSDASQGGQIFTTRMFDLPGSTVITPFYDYNFTKVLTLQLQNGDTRAYVPVFAAGHEPHFNSAAVGDLTGNGHDEFIVNFQDGSLIVATANDVANLQGGLRMVNTQVGNLDKVAIGDFNGDGQRDLAGLQIQSDGTLKLLIFTVDPATLAVTLVNETSLTLDSANIPVQSLDMTAGRFNSAQHDQLAIAYGNTTAAAMARIVDFAANSFTPVEKSAYTVNANSTVGYLQIKTGKFGLPQNFADQLVYHMSSESADARFFQILTADETTLEITGHGSVSYAQLPCAFGIEVSNFNKLEADPADPTQTQPTLNDQVALFYCSADSTIRPVLNIYSVDPAAFTITIDSNTDLSSVFTITPSESLGRVFISAVDVQARSVVLGDPDVYEIVSSDQPSVVIGAPPMHVDFITPNSGTSPVLLNLSAIPGAFQTTYRTDTSDAHPHTDSQKTGWSFGAKETLSASAGIGDLANTGDGVQLTDTFKATQELKGSIDTVNSTFMSHATSLSASTGMQDWLVHKKSDRRVWVYPVVGQKVCPAAKPDCADEDKVQLTIQFVAPTSDHAPQGDDGDDLSWYQPPWEPGNVFSYPANYQQLMGMYPGGGTCISSGGTSISQATTSLCQLAVGEAFATDSTAVTQTTTWTVTSSTETDTGFNQNYSFENDFSVAGGVNAGIANTKASADLDISGSVALSHTTTDTTTLSESTGLSITKPGSFLDQENYRYLITPYIVGTTVAGGVVDNQPLSTDVQTFGLLRAIYTADMTNAGNWWGTAYGLTPDVALNHPARWKVTHESSSAPNCRPSALGTVDCISLNDRTPGNPWGSVLQFMRGFFISSANAPGQGPQLQTANARDVLTLQARVYNYSLAEMGENTQVHVRFYFTPWSKTGNVAAGPSVLISEEVRDPIPPFNSTLDGDVPKPPNWVLVPTTFDTGKFPETQNGADIVFWVVVWMQDKTTQQLVPEIAGHGLTAIPPTQASGSESLFATVSGVEECQPDGSCYGNNLGFYPQIFSISAPSTPGARPPLPRDSVDITKLEMPARRVTPRDNVPVTATLISFGGSTGVHVNFYDGDPSQGGRSFAYQVIPSIQPSSTADVQGIFQSNTCGVHQLFVVVNRGTPREIVRRAPPLQVVCNGR